MSCRDVDRLVEQARERSENGWFHSPRDVRILLWQLADAVERLEAERDDDFVEKFSATHDALEQLRARVAALEAGVTQIAAARCLGDRYPPGCAGSCVTCQARALVASTGQETT